jgi:hypothetical protein
MGAHHSRTRHRSQDPLGSPTFLAEDVAATARWYVDNLGFTIAGNFPKSPPTLRQPHARTALKS